MNAPADPLAILDRLKTGSLTAAEIELVRQLLMPGDTPDVVQLGKYSVYIAQGEDIHIGDRIYQGANAEAIRNIIRSVPKELADTPQSEVHALKPINEIVAAVRSQLETIERQRHGTMLLWRVNEPVPVDEIYVDVEILERPTKEFSSDKDGLLQTF